ncbi:MAG: peptide chain release factor N(5)-glutamine methyltransferase [Chloroflexi bacterium]|nr:peptide chain release factor N(5)-glutamine methyltransferase [Chloroflexota bacterium]
MPSFETIQDALLDATRALGVTMEYHEARLQAEILLAHSLETSREMVLARLDETITTEVAARYAGNVARRAKHEPLAYIVGHKNFYGLDFIVDRRVLIPRHETEILVQLALERARRIATPVIVDVGTGSGAIALTLAHNLSQARVFALDKSPAALVVARMNAERLRLMDRVEFLQSDLLEAFTGSFDILISNLPYIPTARIAQLAREIRDFEPRAALDGGEDGLGVMRRLLGQLQKRSLQGTITLLEISEEQGQAAQDLVYQILPQVVPIVHRDLEELDRVVELQFIRASRP